MCTGPGSHPRVDQRGPRPLQPTTRIELCHGHLHHAVLLRPQPGRLHVHDRIPVGIAARHLRGKRTGRRSRIIDMSMHSRMVGNTVSARRPIAENSTRPPQCLLSRPAATKVTRQSSPTGGGPHDSRVPMTVRTATVPPITRVSPGRTDGGPRWAKMAESFCPG